MWVYFSIVGLIFLTKFGSLGKANKRSHLLDAGCVCARGFFRPRLRLPGIWDTTHYLGARAGAGVFTFPPLPTPPLSSLYGACGALLASGAPR